MSSAAEAWPTPPSNLIPFRDNEGLRDSALHSDPFWGTRPELRSIYQNSRRFLTAPWAMLGIALMRSLHSIPHNIHYRSSLSTAPLNSMLMLVGDSGGGKSLISRQVDEALPILYFGRPIRFDPIEPGSGEGIADAYAGVAEKDDPANNISRGDLLWWTKTHSAMFSFDEVGRLTTSGGRPDSILFEQIKQGVSGATIGRKLKGRLGTQLPSGSYRMTVIVNAQPTRCEPFFTDSEVAGGFPGRPIWMETRDPQAISEQDDSMVEPYVIKEIDWRQVDCIEALPEMDAAHRYDRLRYHEGERPPLEGHDVLTRAKIAAALMRLNGRVTLNEQDWDLAGMVLAKSKATRESVQERLVDVTRDQDKKRGQTMARQDAFAAEAAHALALRRVVSKLREYERAERPQGEWRRSLTSRDRDLYDEALAVLQGRA